MVLWILVTSLAYAAALGTAVGATAYFAATRFSVAQRLLAGAADRALRKICGGAAYSVTHTDTGIVATDVRISPGLLAATEFGGSQAMAAAVGRLEVQFPSLVRPLTLRVSRLRLAVQQVQLPQPLAPEERAAAERQRAAADRAARLSAVEQLLWGSPSAAGAGSARSRWDPAAGGMLGRLQARALQRLLAVAVQYVRLEVTDVELKYVQYGEPGPRPAASYLQGADGACLRVRSLTLLPQGNVPTGTAAAAAGAPAEAAAGSEPASSVIDALAASDAGLDGTAAAAAAAAAPADAGQLSWRQLLLHIPRLLWASVATDRPSSTRLTTAGVSLSLLTFPSTWRGYARAKAAADAAAAQATTPFAFTPGRSSTPFAAAALEASPGKRRRAPRVTAQRLAAPRAPPQLPTQQGAGTLPAPAAQDVQQQQQQQLQSSGGSWHRGCWALLQALPVEEHVLFRQWEFSITACLLPPGWAPQVAAERGGRSTGAAAAQAGGPDMSRCSSASASWLGTPRFAFARRSAATPAHSAPAASSSSVSRGAPSPPQRRAAGQVNGEHPHLSVRLGTPGAPLEESEEDGQLSPVLHPVHFEEDDLAAGPSPPVAPVRPPRHPQLSQRPVLDRSSMWAEAPTPVSHAERQAFAADASAPAASTQQQPPLSLPPNGVAANSPFSSGSGGGRQQGAVPTPAVHGGEAASEDGTAACDTAAAAAEGAAAAGGAGPAGAAGGGSGSASDALLLDVAVCLKALVPEINAASLAILNRLVDRQLHHAHYGAFWAARPQVPVHEHAAAWWQHAGEALAAECGRALRCEVPLAALEQRGRRRREYQALYAAKHARTQGFQEPGLRWWQRRRVRPAAADDLQRLKALEAQLTAEEVAHFRYGVAAIHNARLASSPALRQFVADKLDCVVYNREPLSPALLEQLLHLDQAAEAPAPAAPAAAPKNGSARTRAGASSAAPAVEAESGFGLRIALSCPKLGLALSMRSPAAAPAPPTVASGLSYMQLTLQAISAELEPSGRLSATVDRLACGLCDSPVGAIPTHTKILSAPSSVCRSVCRAADFFQYAVHGTIAEEALSPDVGTARAFLAVSATPRMGSGGLTVDSPAEAAAVWSPSQWCPGGTDMSVRLAAVTLTYHAPPFAALLHFLDAWDTCKVAPWGWAIPRAPPGSVTAGAAPVDGAAGAPAAPPLPSYPEPVPEMVLQSFSMHGTPVLGALSLHGSSLDVRCPGVAVQLPYEHNAQFDLRGGAAAARHAAAEAGGPEDPPPPLRYALTIAAQNLHVVVTGEEAAGCLQGGAARRTDATAYVDVFSYMSSESRRAVATRLVPARVTFDASRRTATDELQEVESLESLLREVEIASMAKVWAYPDDLAAIMVGISTQEQRHGARVSLANRLRGPSMLYRPGSLRRMEAAAAANFDASAPLGGTSSGAYGTSRGGGASVAGGMPPEFIHDPSKYPMPHIPFLKCGSLRSHIVMPLKAMPGEPGGAELAVAASAMGLQTWVSPLHIWHLLSVERAVRDVFQYVERTRPAAEEPRAAGPEAGATQAQPPQQAQQQAPLARPRSPKLLLSVGVAQVSLLWLIGTWTPKGNGSGGRGGRGITYRRAWGISVKRDDDAYLWARWLAPVYSVMVANVKAALRLQSNGSMNAAASVDGIVVRDLQLPETARHAYVLRPLPARARRLNAWHAELRRIFLGITPMSPARKHWMRAVQTVVLRQRTSARLRLQAGGAVHLGSCALLGLALPLSGPQAGLTFRSTPASRFRPAAAELTAEVGQMLAYVRIKQQASMTAFATQLTQITDALAPSDSTSSSGASSPQRCATPAAGQAPPAAPTLPKLQTALKVTISVVGIDVLFRVQSRDLMSIKLDQGRVALDQRPVTRLSGPRDVRLHLGVSIHDVVIRDLRARVEHSLVLVPHGGEECCSVEAAFTSYVDPRRCGPRLNLLVQNPRVLLLFRFVSDVMGALSIISSAAKQTEDEAGATGAASAAAGAPAAGAAAEAVKGAAAAAGDAAAAAATGEAAATPPPARSDPPLEVLIELHNLGVVLPTTAYSSSTLGATVEHLLIALPGGVMPAAVLEECELPQVVSMMQEAVKCTREFKLSSFHDRPGAAGGPPAEPAAAEAGGAADTAPPGVDCAPAAASAAPAEEAIKRQGLKQRLKSGVDALAGAAAAQAPGAAGAMGKVPAAQAVASARKDRDRRRRPPGVLFLDEAAAQVTPSGVLHIPPGAIDAGLGPEPEALEAEAQRAREMDLPIGAGAPLDWKLGDVVDTVGRGFRNLIEGEPLAESAPGPPPAKPSRAAGGGEAGAGVRLQRPPSVPLMVEDTQKTNLNPLLLDASEDFAPREERPLPDPSFVIAIDSFTVTRGQLVRVPNFFYQKQKGSDYVNPRQGSFLPPSLASFSWPIDVWDLVVGAPFIKPTHIALAMFRQPEADAPLLHFSASQLNAVMNAPNFTALMDFIGGNLDEYLHPELHQDTMQGGAATPEPPPPEVPPQVRFNPSMRFGPQPGQAPYFRLTVATPRLSVVFESHPREWTDHAPAWLYAGASDAAQLRPFMRFQVSRLAFDLGVADKSATFMRIDAHTLDLQDLRLAYRLQEFVRQSRPLLDAEASSGSDTEGDAAMVTPPSHLDSGQTTPTFGDAAELQQRGPRQPFGGADAAGSAAGRDGLAPPEVRQRVLSDAAAAQLLLEGQQRKGGTNNGGTTGEAAPTEAGQDDQMMRLYNAARHATMQLHHGAGGGAGDQPDAGQSVAHHRQNSSLVSADLSDAESLLGALADTPATPSTGGFSFMLPGSSRHLPSSTPGLLGTGSAGGSSLLAHLGTGERQHSVLANTGLRLSVARRLSEQAERRRSVHTPSTGGSALGSAGGGSAGGATGSVGGASGGPSTPGEHPHPHGRVIDFIPEGGNLAGVLGDGEDVAVVRVLSAPQPIPPIEATGARSRLPPGSAPGVKLEVSLSMLADSTMAVEVAMSEVLLNWPYFKDLSLIWSISNLFSAPWSPQRPPNERDDLRPAPRRRGPSPTPPHATGPSAWLYFNLLVSQSQIFVPVYDVAGAQEMSSVLWNAPDGEQKSGFEQVADMALAFAVMGEVDEKHERLALEDRGLALTTTALRFAYSYGGDGETNIKVDLRDTAAFVRDPAARVNCAMLPFSLKLDLDMKVPQAAEQWEVERLHRAATQIQQAWRRHVARRADAAASAQAAALPQAVALLQGVARSATGPRRLDSMLAAVETVEHGDPAGKPWQLVDELVMEVASPYTRKLLHGYRQQSQDRSQLMYLQRYRATSSTVLRIEAGSLTLRAAFSHIPFWRAASAAVQRVVLAPAVQPLSPSSQQAACGPSCTAGLPRPPSTDSADEAAELIAGAVAAGAGGREGSPGGGTAAPAPALPFRPSSLQIHVGAQQATVVLCNDKPETFGAPDVLQCSLAGVVLAYDTATLLPDRPPNKAGRLALKSYASFLNSSTSRWEALYDSWPLTAEFVDIVSPVYLSDRQTNVWLTSEQHLDLNFNPASLLSIGDALAFMREAQEHSILSGQAGEDLLQRGGSDMALQHGASFTSAGTNAAIAAMATGVNMARRSSGPAAPVPAPTAAAGPAPSASAASCSGVVSRAPQKYLIQNQTGMKVFYWTEGSKDAPRSPVYCLDSGGSENLRVVPASKRLSFVQFGSSAVGSERMGATINLHFEGNWMPVVDVAVNVVGKYRYRMTSPADSTWVPLIIDIILVGRTKIITLHSGVWVENAIDRDVSLRLHVPTTSLVPPPAGSGARATGGYSVCENDIAIGPLKPGAGCYLPLTAVLGGRLFLRPSGFQEASRDVIRLSPDIAVMLTQQGFMSCEPDLLGLEEVPLHVSLQAIPAKLVSEFQAFKHMECLAPGTIQKASAPLEVTLSVQPTLVLQNALPYEMRVLLWQHLPSSGDAGLGAPLMSGTLPPQEHLSPRPSMGPASTGRRRTSQTGSGPINAAPRAPHEAFLDFISPRGAGSTAANRRGSLGRYFAHSISPGGSVNLYLDMRQVVQMHVSVEEIGMRSTKWATVSHGARSAPTADGSGGLEAPPKLPHEVPLRMVGVGMGLPTSLETGGAVDRYLGKLKDVALHMRMLHAQFHYDTRLAVSRADVEAAWGRLRAMARRASKASGNFVHDRVLHSPGGTRRRGRYRQGAEGSSPLRATRRARFPTIVGPRARRDGMVELPGQGAALAKLQPVSSLDDEVAGVPPARAGGIAVRHASAGHIIVGPARQEEQPEPPEQQRVTVTAEAIPPAGPQAATAQQEEQEERAGGLGPPPLALHTLREASIEGSLGAHSVSAASTPKAAAVAPSSLASPSHASEAQLLSDVPLSASPGQQAAPRPPPGVTAGSAPRVAAGRVAKRSAGPSRFARALSCFDWGRQSSGGDRSRPPPAASSGAARVEAAVEVGSPGGAASSANPSPSMDSRTSSRVLLSDRVKRSELLPEEAERSPVRGSTGDEGVVVGLEAVPESPASAQQAQQSPASPPLQQASPKPLARLSSPLWGRRKTQLQAEAAAAAAAQALEQEEEEEETPERRLLRDAFDAWRLHCADAVWRRHGRREGAVPAGSPRSERSDAMDDVQVRTPPLLHLGLHNSLSERGAGGAAAGSARITLFSPYWLNNRTGVDLFYQDHLSAPGQPFLFGAALPWDYGEVFTPGTSMTETLSREPSEMGGFEGLANGAEVNQALLEYKLVLMNKQEDVMVGLAHVPQRRYSPGIKITTVGNKSSLELRGPMETTPLKPRDVPMAVAAGLASGLRGAMSVATGAAEALRSQGSQQLRAAAEAAEAEEYKLREIVSQVSLRESASQRSQRSQQAQQEQLPAALPSGQQPPRESPFVVPADPGLPAGTAGGPGALAGASSNSLPGRSPSSSAQGTPAQGTPGALTPTAAAAFASKPKHLRRASMQDNSVMETMATQPGTMLVRVTSGVAGTPAGRALHRLGSSISGNLPLSSRQSMSLQQAPAPDKEVDAAVRSMQEIPLPPDPAAAGQPEGGCSDGMESDEESEEEAGGCGGAAAAAVAGSEVVPPGASGPSRDALESAADTLPEDAAAADAAGGSGTVHQQHAREAEAARLAAQSAGTQATVSATSMEARRSSGGVSAVQRVSDARSASASSRFVLPGEAEAEQAAHAAGARSRRSSRRTIRQGAEGEVVRSQKAYEFAVDVTAGPPDSMFRHTKLLTLKPKYMIENQTGLPMLMKQFRTPDPEGGWWAGDGGGEGDAARFARALLPGSRAAVYWDDAELARELVVRPAPLGEEDDWHWSGSFPIRETEWYFGLRIRHKHQRARYMNIPVNVTVGPYGSIQVTLKSPSSVPPYRIENSCQDVQLYFIQLALVNRPTSKRYVDNLPPGQAMPYAWDEPTQRNLIRVQARVAGKESDSRIADYALDHLGDQPMLLLPTHGGKASASAQRRLYKSISQNASVPDDVKQKLVSLLAAEFSKKVYVSVYADGPTRVLRFSDDKNVSSQEAQNLVLDLAARLKQVETQLRQVNAQFARLNGMSGANVLDLYGRTAAQQLAPAVAAPELRRAASKRLPLRETTRALLRQAHSKLPQSSLGSPAGGDGAGFESLPGSVAGSLPVSRMPSTTAGQGPGLSGANSGLSMGGAMSRQATVRFDVPSGGSGEAGVVPRISSARFASERGAGGGPRVVPRVASAGAVGAGVLQIPDEREERLQPYRRLMIRTGSEPGTDQPSPTAPAAEIQPEPAEAPDAAAAAPAAAAQQWHTTTTLRAPQAGRDWGHITPSANQAAGTRTLAASASKLARDRGGTGPPAAAGVSGWKRRQDLLRGINSGDAVLLLGGDLNVTVVQAQGLYGSSKSTHPFARVYISEPFPTSTEERAKQTTVVWQSCDPVWDEQLLFRDVCAASELGVELWDLGGTRSAAQLHRLAQNPSEVIKTCRFLGRAEVALADTLSMLSGVPPGTPLWLPLMRRDAGDAVSGQLQLRFVWEVTARSLLTIKLHALERVLAQRQEILAALQPVPAEVVRTWAPLESDEIQAEAVERTARAGIMGAGVSLFGVDNELGMSGAGWAVKPSKVATEVLARHAHDHNRRHLVVTVLQAKGLTPRRGVVVALSANELPNPMVSVELGRFPTYNTPVIKHTLQPRWDASVRHVFGRVDPAEAALAVRLYDSRGGFRAEQRLLGQGTIHCAQLKGENPTYVWVPLYKPRRRREKGAVGVEDEVSDMQVHLRLQWQTEAVRGQSTKVEVDLAGLSLVVMGGLQDELFNLTTDEIKSSAVRTRLEVKVAGTVQKVQLDNQMLDAVQPVVLAPAVEYRPSGAVGSAIKESPLMSFSFTRSFAGSGKKSSGSEGERSPVAAESTSPTADSEAELAGSAGEADKQSIKSFKDIRLDIGAMDLQTDEAFLEALLSFFTSIPTADVHQDRPWRQQQRRLLAAQFGPREVESLAVNAIVPTPGEEEEGEGPLDWVVEKEFRNLEVLHGQSDLSSWYFIESAEIGALEINVTVSLSSRLLSAGRSPAVTKASATGAFNRALGASGFSLVNVANVPIQLGKWVVGNDPANSSAAGSRGLVSNGFLSQKALVNNLARHYTREGLKEAHKVLGGAGPAVASVPLAVLWAGGSAYVLLRSITAGNTGPVVAMQQLAYVPLMTLSMLSSGFSRMLAAVLAALPPYRANGDDAIVQRIIKRPNSALEALARAPMELFYGFSAAGCGLLMDPIAGWQEARGPGLAMGVLKALVGLMGRPMVGALEGTSKLFHSLALASLGREGILGKMQRRVKAPGAFAEVGAEQAEEEPRREAEAQMRQLMAAWQRVLPEFFPGMAGDTVSDVINVRASRVVLITDHHIAYLRARHQSHQSIYKAKWLVPISEIQNLSGDSETLKIQLTHVHRYDLWVMGVWPVQKRKGLRCASRAIYERMVIKLSRLLQKGRGEGGDEEEAMDPGLRRFAGASLADLAILSRPYAPPPLALPAPPALGGEGGAAARGEGAQQQQAQQQGAAPQQQQLTQSAGAC